MLQTEKKIQTKLLHVEFLNIHKKT